ncbi:hypothetical protein Tco_0589858 [Tanacetum coccineum]
MLVQPTKDEGEASERQSEPLPTPSPPYSSADQHEIQPDSSPIPLPTIPIPDSIPEGSGGNHGGQSSSDRSLSGNEDGLTLQSIYDLCVSLCKQVIDQAKEIKHLKTKGYINKTILKIEPLPKIDPKDKGKKVLEEEAESDAESEGVDEAERKFDQLAKDEEIARKRLQEEERETFTVKERAKFLYDTIAAQRRFLAQQRAAAIRSIPPTRTQLRNQMMTYLKHVGGKKHADLKNKNLEEIQIKEMNEESKDPIKKRVVKETPKEEVTAKVPAEQEVTEQGTKKRKSGHVKMIASKTPRPQPDDDRMLQRMLDLGLEVEEESTAALHLTSQKLTSPKANASVKTFSNPLCAPCYYNEALTSPKQTAFGKDKSNPLIVDSLLKTIRLSIYLVVYNEELAIPEQTATGKGISNPLMAGSLPKTTKPT